MNRPIEQAIENLIPRHSNSIPSILIDLANSLFVQSRSKCILRAEEEVARAYACANLACERLKGKLDLPIIEPRPPIPPRAYEKLYAYISGKLDPKTPSRKRKQPTSSKTSTAISVTPSKSIQPWSMLREKPKTKAEPLNKSTVEKDCDISNEAKMEFLIPLWVLPTIRLLCKHMQTPKVAPHVLAGVESILCLPIPEKARSHSFNESELKLPAMIAAVWALVLAKISGREEQGRDNMEDIRPVLKFLGQIRKNEGLIKKIGQSEDSWRGWESIIESDVNAWIKEIEDGGWKELDWWRNIFEITGHQSYEYSEDELGHDIPVEDKICSDGESDFKKNEVNNRYDYLSENRKQEFAEWMSKMLLQINKMIDTRYCEN
ncbi:hypothetical protein HI914_02752 [Erysiphe necator]|nr:hypothetical protein HI914_02752 [Erysiphe necator]